MNGSAINFQQRTFHWERMADLRRRLGLSQIALAAEANMHPGQIARMEAGYYDPSIKNLVRVCQGLHCSADYLLGLRDEP